MPSYTVQAVEQAASGTSERGAWTRQKLTLQNDTGGTQQATLFCNQYQPVPAVGSTIEGTLKAPKQDGWLPELDVPRKGGGGGGGRSKPPEERRSIAMQHAQKCAVTILSVAAEHGEYKPPAASEVVGHVKAIAAALFEQVQQAEAGS